MKVISNEDGDILCNFDNNKKMIFQFLRGLLFYQPKLNPYHNKIC